MPHLTTFLSLVLALTAASQAPAPASRAQSHDDDGDVQIRINGPIHIAASDSAFAIWVVNHDAVIDGVVREGLVVINGTARVSGRVEGGVVVVNGRLELGPARVSNTTSCCIAAR